VLITAGASTFAAGEFWGFHTASPPPTRLPPPPRPLPKLCVSLSTVITEESDCHCHYHYSHSVAQGLLSPAVAVVRSGTGRGFSALPVVWLCENIFAFIALHIIVID